jgi:hypothetical protein
MVDFRLIPVAKDQNSALYREYEPVVAKPTIIIYKRKKLARRE